MKRFTLLFIVLSVFLPGMSEAQDATPKFEITPTAGYFLGGSLKFYEGKLKIRDNVSYGLILGMPIRRGTRLELSYTGMSSTAEWRPNLNYADKYPSRNFKMNVNYFLVGGSQDAVLSPKVRGFGGVRLGMAWFNTTAGDIDDVFRFAASLGGGLKVYLTQRVGLRFQANMLIPLYFSGGGIFCGIGGGGSGTGVSLSSTSSIIQADFSGGLVIMLGE